MGLSGPLPWLIFGMLLMLVLVVPMTYSGTTFINQGFALDLADRALCTILTSAGQNATCTQVDDTFTFVNGTGISIIANSTTKTLYFNNTGGGADQTSASNLGAGEGIFAQEIGDDLEFKSLTVDGTGVTLTDNTTDVGLGLDNIAHDSITDCADGEILKWATGGGEWGCAADVGGGAGDDLGDHVVDQDLQVGTFDIDFQDAGQLIDSETDGIDIQLPTGDLLEIEINSVSEYNFNAARADFQGNSLEDLGTPTTATHGQRVDHLQLNNLVTSDCANGSILEFQTSNSTWICGTDDTGGGGSNELLDGVSHTDTAVQTVTRGSMIYGDSSPEWNELVIGPTDTVLTTDGNDPIWAKVSNADHEDVSQNTVKGRIAAGNGPPVDLTETEVTAMLNIFTDALKGLVPNSGGGTDNFLRADGTWTAPPSVSSIHSIANVTNAGCAENEILKVNSSAIWDCATDNSGGSSDIISEGDSNVEVIDLGTGEINFDLDGALEFFVNATHFDFNTNQIAGSMGCTNQQIIEYDSANDEWVCIDKLADPKIAILTAGGATLQAASTPAKTTLDGTNMDYIVLDFDTSSSETVIWNWELPENADASQDIDVRVRFQVASGTAGVCWDGSWLGRTAGETVDSSFGTVIGGCDSTTGTNSVETATLTFTSAQHGLAAGDSAFFKLSRDVLDGTDTNANDARLIDVRITWS